MSANVFSVSCSLKCETDPHPPKSASTGLNSWDLWAHDPRAVFTALSSHCVENIVWICPLIITDDGLVSSPCVFVEQRETKESRLDLRGKNSASCRCRRTPDFNPPRPWTSLTSRGRTRSTGTHTSPSGVFGLSSSDPKGLSFLWASTSFHPPFFLDLRFCHINQVMMPLQLYFPSEKTETFLDTTASTAFQENWERWIIERTLREHLGGFKSMFAAA